MTFWETAWYLRKELEAHSADLPTASGQLVELLGSDAILQRYIFSVREFSDPSWLSAFKRGGLFDDPPPVVRTEDGLRADPWPVLDYLTAIAPSSAEGAADVLLRLETDNWWVISAAIRAANALPIEKSVEPILHLLRLLDSSRGFWPREDDLGESLLMIDGSQTARAQLRIAGVRVFAMLARADRAYDLDGLLERLAAEASPAAHSLLANAAELSIAGDGTDQTSYAIYGRLDEGDDAFGDGSPVGVLVRWWIVLVESEQSSDGASASLVRALRLLGMRLPLLEKMGLRALRLALALEPLDPLAIRQAEWVISQDRFVWDHTMIGESMPLVRVAWPSLAPSTQASFATRLGEASSGERLDQFMARDWLHALRGNLGPVENETLANLVHEYGPAREESGITQAMASWVGPESFISAEDASMRSAESLVALMRHVPGRNPSQHWGPSPDGFTRVVEGQVSRRPEEFVPLLQRIGPDVDYPGLHSAVMEGLRQAYQDDSPRESDVAPIAEFMVVSVERALGGELTAPEEYPVSPSHVTRSAVDLVEASTHWSGARLPVDSCLKVLSVALRDEFGSAEEEGSLHTTDDPPTAGLNSLKGKAVRASLSLLFSTDEDEPVSDLKEMVIDVARSEESPAAVSGFGLFLPQLISKTPDLWSVLRAPLMSEEGPDRWGAVWGTYIAFHPPYRDIAASLDQYYERAISRKADGIADYSASVFSRLISHLLALFVDAPDADSNWGALSLSALAAATDNESVRALSSLGRALGREAPQQERRSVEELMSGRLNQLRSNREPRIGEASAIADLLLSEGAEPEAVTGMVLDAIQLGGRPEPRRLLEYLDSDPLSPELDMQVLTAAVGAGSFERWFDDRGALRSVLQRCGSDEPEGAWDLVNTLGSNGHLYVEPEAQEIHGLLT